MALKSLADQNARILLQPSVDMLSQKVEPLMGPRLDGEH